MHVSRHESIILEIAFRGLDGRLEDPTGPVEVYLRSPGGGLSRRRMSRVKEGKYRHRQSASQVGDYRWRIETGDGYIEKGKPLTVYPDRNSILVIDSLRHRHTIEEAATLESETLSYIHRVEADGGTVHDKDWVNTVISKLKDLGVYADCVYLGDANMGTDVASTGSAVATLYDASGNENDATQSDSAKKPTLATRTEFTDKLVAEFDGTDDVLTAVGSGPFVQPNTVVVCALLETPGDSDFDFLISGSQDTNEDNTLYSEKNGDWRANAGRNIIGSVADTNRHVFGVVFNGASSVMRLDGSQDASGDIGTRDLAELSLGNREESQRGLDGPISFACVFDARISDSDISEIETLVDDYYS